MTPVWVQSVTKDAFESTNNSATQNTQYLILRYKINLQNVLPTPHTSFIAGTSKCLFRWSMQLIL
jgi:hypothetical protein